MTDEEAQQLDQQVAEAFGFKPEITWEILNADEDATMIGFRREAEARKWWDEHPSVHKDRHIGTWKHYPPFSTDIAAAMSVVEKMRERYTNVNIHGANGWGVSFGHIAFVEHELGESFSETWTPVVNAPTLPEAICRAALKSVEATTGAGEK